MITLGEPSTDLPTEPGTYLFTGIYDIRRVALDGSRVRYLRTEIVRVHPYSQGKIGYIGSDFMYEPQHARGLWIRVDFGEVQAAATALVFDEHVKLAITRVFSDKQGLSRNAVIYCLVGYGASAEKSAGAEAMINRAVALGLIREADGRCYFQEER